LQNNEDYFFINKSKLFKQGVIVMEKETIKKIFDLFEEDNYVDAKAILTEAVKKEVKKHVNSKLDIDDEEDTEDEEKDDDEEEDDEEEDEEEDD